MPTILLIEDNADIRENTGEILEMAGYTVLMAENGQAGVETALATRPDLVVYDIVVLDGYGALQFLNQNPQLAGIPPSASSPPKLSAPTCAAAWSREPTTTSPSPSTKPGC